MPNRILSTTVKGLDQLEQLGPEIELRRRLFLHRAAEALADDIRDHAPRRTGTRLAPSIKGEVIGESTIEVGSFGTEFAEALEDGAFIRAKPRATKTGRPPALRFQVNGQTIFRRHVLLARNAPKRGFFRKRLRQRGRILDRAFAQEFDDL